MGRPQGNPQAFQVLQSVRYKPGGGTYGYEDGVEQDGRIPAVVIGHSPTRVRIKFACGGRVIVRCVDAASLRRVMP